MPLAYGVGFALLPAAMRALESPYCLRQYGLWNRPIACGNTGSGIALVRPAGLTTGSGYAIAP